MGRCGLLECEIWCLRLFFIDDFMDGFAVWTDDFVDFAWNEKGLRGLEAKNTCDCWTQRLSFAPLLRLLDSLHYVSFVCILSLRFWMILRRENENLEDFTAGKRQFTLQFKVTS